MEMADHPFNWHPKRRSRCAQSRLPTTHTTRGRATATFCADWTSASDSVCGPCVVRQTAGRRRAADGGRSFLIFLIFFLLRFFLVRFSGSWRSDSRLVFRAAHDRCREMRAWSGEKRL